MSDKTPNVVRIDLRIVHLIALLCVIQQGKRKQYIILKSTDFFSTSEIVCHRRIKLKCFF